MDLIGAIVHHGYAIVAAVMFLAAAGLPLPTSIVLIGAGAAAHQGLHLEALVLLAWTSALLGDTLLYFGGRTMGWWLLAAMCRLTINPEGCIFSSSAYFYRRGAKTLLFAKWVPGLASMAAPLAGSLHMSFRRFFRLDATGVLLYVVPWTLVGYLFSRFITQIVDWVQRLGHAFLLIGLLLVAGYVVAIAVFTWKARKYNNIPKITAESLRERLLQSDPNKLFIIADVRSHGYYDPGMQRIKNSIRVEPSRLQEELVALREFMAPECEVYLYCSCIRDTTSKRVAHMLEEANCRTHVIDGGIKAWVKAGGELEPVPPSDIEHLPRFE
jgi:membrane protein DedA with SNARE-associated domain/rhodanese-related sulfurtransferase